MDTFLLYIAGSPKVHPAEFLPQDPVFSSSFFDHVTQWL